MPHYLALADAAALIRSGAELVVAGAEPALDALPPGDWIGGTTPYFMTTKGAVIDNGTGVFVNDLSELGSVSFAWLTSDRLGELASDAPAHGFTLVIIPSLSRAHRRFAAEFDAAGGAASQPLAGWVSGVHRQHLGHFQARVYLGAQGHGLADGAVVARVALPPLVMARLDVIDVFEAEPGDVIRFDESSFKVSDCSINGRRLNLARYLAARGRADGLLPLIRQGAERPSNVAFRSIDPDQGTVALMTPVFPGIDYRLAKPLDRLARERQASAGGAAPPVFTAHCVENFLYGAIDETFMRGLPGPVGFGQIAQRLLNQTTVSVHLQPAPPRAAAPAA